MNIAIRLTQLLLIVGLLSGAGQAASAQSTTEVQVPISSFSASVSTGQDYSPWLDDNVNNPVQNYWMPANFQYVDVTLQLAQSTTLTRLSLYDGQGIFQVNPCLIYAQKNGQRTLIGTFTGDKYNVFVDLPVSGTVGADAIVVHKYCNNIPLKIKVFGQTTGAVTTPVAQPTAVLTFGSLAALTVGNTTALSASSSNSVTPITYTSSNSAVASVSQTSSGSWQATAVSAGSATITATQAAGNGYLAATSVSQSLTVAAAVVAPTTPVATAPVVTTPASGTTTTGLIPITASRWYQLTNAPNTLAPVFDGNTATESSIGWGKLIDPYDAYYALQPGESMSIDHIRFFDGGNSNADKPFTLSVITDSWQRIPIATFTGLQYNRWVGPDPNQPDNFALSSPISNVRYLVITTSWAYPTEIELYGTYTSGTPLATTNVAALAAAKNIKLRQEMGVNAFEWDVEDPNNPGQVDETRLTAVKNFTAIRHYLDWQKLEGTQGGYTFNPSHSGGWNYDIMYQRLKAENVDVLACIKTLPDWLLASYPGDQRDSENVPVPYGSDFSNPASYVAQAKLGFQFAARYGANTGVNTGLLSVDQSTRWSGDGVNQVKVGLNLVKYVECDNERDKWWKGRKAYQSGREYAANLSAFYDGHKGTLGQGVGVKAADPSMQVVMAGLANPTVDYVRGMIDWCKQYRGYKADGSVNLCWDVINYHLYSNDASSSQGGNATRGAAPEVSNAAQVAQNFITLAHQYAADMPVWITETGYDTNQGSPLHAIAIGSKSVLQTQADWILRSALLYARWGVERTFHYQLADENPSSSTQFASMGLINSDHSAKPAADYLRQVNKLIGDYTYAGTISSDPIVDRYQSGTRTAYTLVVPDEKNRTASYTLSLGTDSAVIYQPQAGQANPKATPVRTQNGQLQLTVTETPLIVVAGSAATTPTASTCAGTGSIGWEQWKSYVGLTAAGIPVGNTPSATATLTQFQSAVNIGDFYGARIRGYVCAPQTGSYTFRIAGDDDCLLYLSTDDNAANKRLIASVTGWTNVGEWTKYSSQQSATITLQAGQRYYIEALHHEVTGGDFVAVAWTMPGGQVEAPIQGSHLIPFAASATNSRDAAALSATQTLAVSSATDGASASPGLTVYPNPFSGDATLSFTLPTDGQATLELYDAQNRLVQRVYSGAATAGQTQQFTIAGAGLAAGVYVARLVTGSTVQVQRLVKSN